MADNKWIKDRLLELGKNQNQLAEALGLSHFLASNLILGKRRGEISELPALARFLDLPVDVVVARMCGVDTPLPGQTMPATGANILQVRVLGSVAAGAWRESLDFTPTNSDEFIYVTANNGYKSDQLFGLRVMGDSMDMIFGDGSYVVVVRPGDYRDDVRIGEYVVVSREKFGNFEITIKELALINGVIYLLARSSNPLHSPIKFEMESEELKIIGVVVGSYTPAFNREKGKKLGEILKGKTKA